MSSLPNNCEQCKHDMDAHQLVNASEDGSMADGGFVLCPVKKCDCYSTWGINGAEPVGLPDRFAIEIIREKLQGLSA